MTLLFTGASGYIGSHCALNFLQNTDYEVVIYDNLSTGFIENVKYLQKLFGVRVSFLQGDVGDVAKLDRLMQERKISAVVHFAASIIVPESLSNPILYYKNNTLNTILLIELCIKHHINKFIFSSTAAVYGEPDSTAPLIEEAKLLPITPYGASKMMSERVLLDTSLANKDFNYVALRYFNVAGANMENSTNEGLGQRSKNATHLIKVACELACGKREKMSVFGRNYDTKDGTCIRDYIHVDDLSSAHLKALEYLDSKNKSQIFNVGYGYGYSVLEVLEVIQQVCGKKLNIVDSPPRGGDPAILIASSEKLRKLTDWKPKFNDLTMIIKSAYEWEKTLR